MKKECERKKNRVNCFDYIFSVAVIWLWHAVVIHLKKIHFGWKSICKNRNYSAAAVSVSMYAPQLLHLPLINELFGNDPWHKNIIIYVGYKINVNANSVQLCYNN